MMVAPPLPYDETARLDCLRAYALLDTPPEPIFDSLTSLAAQIAHVPVALISLVDANRQWFKSCYGTDLTETDREVAFCAHTILQSEPLIIEDAFLDPRFKDNPLVEGPTGVRFYAGFPIVSSSGHALGTLCVIAHEPHSLAPKQISILSALAAQVEVHLELRRDMHEERAQTSGRHELLNHLDRELHTTLNGIVSAQQLLGESPLDPDQQTYLEFSSQATDHLVFLIEHLRSILAPSTPVG